MPNSPEFSTIDPRPLTDRLIGTLVHRLFQAGAEEVDPKGLSAAIAGLIRAEERVDIADLEAVTRATADAFLRLRTRPDVREALSSGRVFYEVPFSYTAADRPTTVVRGVIDCLVLPETGGAPIVLEFKTGGSRPEHTAQVEQYAAAVREFLAVKHVEMKILYA